VVSSLENFQLKFCMHFSSLHSLATVYSVPPFQVPSLITFSLPKSFRPNPRPCKKLFGTNYSNTFRLACGLNHSDFTADNVYAFLTRRHFNFPVSVTLTRHEAPRHDILHRNKIIIITFLPSVWGWEKGSTGRVGSTLVMRPS